ncbi:MAG: hypothetical protein IPL69_20480 [Saprospiraceae bacterium]|nr:hypothetical protein [Candidatus Brachybacter algidus]
MSYICKAFVNAKSKSGVYKRTGISASFAKWRRKSSGITVQVAISTLCNYANTILNDIDESEEVVQQVFVQLWEKRETMEITTCNNHIYFGQ